MHGTGVERAACSMTFEIHFYSRMLVPVPCPACIWELEFSGSLAVGNHDDLNTDESVADARVTSLVEAARLTCDGVGVDISLCSSYHVHRSSFTATASNKLVPVGRPLLYRISSTVFLSITACIKNGTATDTSIASQLLGC